MKLHRTLKPVFYPLLFVPTANVAAALLFFFLLSGGFLLQPGIAVQVPESPFLLSPQHDPEVVAITGPPVSRIYFENLQTTPAALQKALAAQSGSGRSVIIKADRQTPAELLVQVVNAAVASGRPVVLATSQPEP